MVAFINSGNAQFRSDLSAPKVNSAYLLFLPIYHIRLFDIFGERYVIVETFSSFFSFFFFLFA